MTSKYLWYCISILTIASNLYAETVKEFPKLTLSAQATLHKPADELQMTIGVVTLAQDAEKALLENSTKMQAVIKSIEALGFTKSDYQTGRFNIHPTYSPPPKNPPPDWRPSINGYEVSNSIAIKTGQLTLAGKLIDTANKAGANSIENIHFTLHDPRSYWDEAIRTATANAINDAKTLASAGGVKLVRLHSISLEHANVITPRGNNVYFAKASSESAPPIEAGDVEITAGVALTYEIAD